jgi:hypothetical protein
LSPLVPIALILYARLINANEGSAMMWTTQLPPRFAAVAEHLTGALLTSQELADRWRLSDQTLRNWRSADQGPPYITLPSGTIRYRMADVLAAEVSGYAGGLTPDRIALELATLDVEADLARRIVEHLRTIRGAA